MSLRMKTDDVALKYYSRECDLRVLANLSEQANAKGISNATLAYAWLLNRGMTALAIGATRLSHIEQAVASVELRLSSEEMTQLEKPYEPHPVIGY